MKPCWPDGDLRAYIDGELPREAGERLSGHIGGCPECSLRLKELSTRAARVSGMMAMLPEVTPSMLAMPRIAAPAHHGRHWAVAGLSLAAAAAVVFLILPKPSVTKGPAAEVPPVPSISAAPAPTLPAHHAAVHHPPTRKPEVGAGFLKLDDEPLETGTIVRVSAGNGEVQADLIVGPDGRAHAIRVVSNQ